jgi:AraC-like DNA-binding protein
MLYGPLVYLYAVTASDRPRGLRRWDALHFVPFAAVVIAGLPIYLMSGAEKVAFAHELELGARPLLLVVVDPLKYASGITYAVVTIVFLQRHRALMKDSYSSLERVNLQWLLRLAAGGAAIWALAVFLQFTEGLPSPLLERQDDIIALAIAVLVYGIGYMALRQPEIFRLATGEYPIVRALVSPVGASAASVPFASPGADQPPPRYERSGLTGREAIALKEGLLAVMEREHPYRNSDLTLDDLAGRLETSPHKLSEVLNAQLDQTFYDFVNGYRVRDVQRRMAEEQSKNLTVLSLALDAGFASKSTFNQAFKKHTGQTPSVYRRSAGG